jgi:prepilin-type N-terminal cleavage/methylation domain-containing protein
MKSSDGLKDFPALKLDGSVGMPGFSMLELLVCVSVLAILSGITIAESGRTFHRDKLNEAALLLRGWLQEISSKPDTIAQSCAITITTGTINTGGEVARVTPTNCSSTPILRMPGQFSGLTFNVGATQTTWSFTRRSAINSTDNVIIKMSTNQITALRCVRVQAISGLLRMGRNNSTSDVSSTGNCTEWSAL